jgi:hypothetical protein
MGQELTRRSFLAASAGLVAATACGKSTSGGAGSGSASGGLTVVQASAQLLTGTDQRVALALFQGKTGTQVVDHGAATFRFGPAVDRLGPPVAAQVHTQGIESRPYFAATTRFDRAGVWTVEGKWNGLSGTARLQVIDPSQTQVPLPGQPMIVTPTPTTADPMGVNPICTRTPPCPFHQVSLDAALGQHRPLAVLFATPALCQSRTCGPVTDVLVSQAPAFADKLLPIHVEIYTDLTGGTTAPAVNAYHLDFEPILFLVNPDGTVKSRLDGPFDDVECRQQLEALVS